MARAEAVGARDRALLCSAALLRSSGVGFASAVLAIDLDKRGLGAAAIGAVVAAGLAGGAAATALVGLYGDRWGRRRTLFALAVLAAAGGVGLVGASSAAGLAACAFLGMVNGMGHDRGGAYALEQSALSHAGGARERTRAFAWYHAAGDAGAALGSLAAALVPRFGYPALWKAYAAAAGAGVLLYPLASPAVELASEPRPLSLQSRRFVARFALLSAVDSLGSGFLTSALIAFYFYKRFGLGEADVALLFLAADLANVASNFLAERLARRLGLLRTMVFTHMPANLLLALLPLCPTFALSAAVFLLRELFIEMDVPTRQSYLSSLVAPEERTAALAGVQLTRTAMWAAAPGLAGWLMGAAALGSPLVVGSSVKIGYDLLLWRAFGRVAPPDEGG